MKEVIAVLGFPECTGLGMWISEKRQRKHHIGSGTCLSKGTEVTKFKMC